ncbi:MAG TPA: NYN domain-containing protein [Bacteroidia bacterium]|nr:NYN domain-containing protein [Bacteroidia bacterium]
MNRCYKVAVLIDGAFFLKRYKKINSDYDKLTAKEIADHLHQLALKHVGKNNDLYRIFYYDCFPLQKKFHNPVSGKIMDFQKDPRAIFRLTLFDELKRKRKVALRLGHLKENGNWLIDARQTKPLLKKTLSIEQIQDKDVYLDIRQKGVDMKIGVDIATLAFKKLADRIILVAGDTDFVPASKLARIEGIDFILDPLWNPIDKKLLEHVDGICTVLPKPIRLERAAAEI